MIDDDTDARLLPLPELSFTVEHTTFTDRVAAQAMTMRPLRLLLTLLAIPFYVIGWLVAFVWFAIVFTFGALKVGFMDARGRFDQRPEAS